MKNQAKPRVRQDADGAALHPGAVVLLLDPFRLGEHAVLNVKDLDNGEAAEHLLQKGTDLPVLLLHLFVHPLHPAPEHPAHPKEEGAPDDKDKGEHPVKQDEHAERAADAGEQRKEVGQKRRHPIADHHHVVCQPVEQLAAVKLRHLGIPLLQQRFKQAALVEHLELRLDPLLKGTTGQAKDKLGEDNSQKRGRVNSEPLPVPCDRRVDHTAAGERKQRRR